jgi:hypothetical protein
MARHHSRAPRQALASVVILLATLGLSSCDKGTSVAGPGTTLTVTASPLQIPANGNAVVTITATRGGRAVGDIEIQLTTTLGRIDQVVVTDTRGIARALLEGTGTSGTAKVTASSGGATPVTLDVTVGLRAERITLTVEPSTVAENANANVTLAALVRNEQGDPVERANVVFGTEIGRLTSGCNIVVTDRNGRAVDTLRLTSGELNTVSDGTIDVRAEVAGGGGSGNATGRVTIRQLPRASFNFSRSGLSVVFTDTSTGNPRTWSWDFGDGNSSSEQNPAHTYAAAGSYIVRLTVRNDIGETTASRLVTVDTD